MQKDAGRQQISEGKTRNEKRNCKMQVRDKKYPVKHLKGERRKEVEWYRRKKDREQEATTRLSMVHVRGEETVEKQDIVVSLI